MGTFSETRGALWSWSTCSRELTPRHPSRLGLTCTHSTNPPIGQTRPNGGSRGTKVGGFTGDGVGLVVHAAIPLQVDLMAEQISTRKPQVIWQGQFAALYRLSRGYDPNLRTHVIAGASRQQKQEIARLS